MNKMLNRAAVATAAIAIALAPLPGVTVLGHWVGLTSAYAGGGSHGNSGGDHGNSSGDHGNSGNSNAGGSANSNSSVHGNSSSHANIASLAGFGNAAHASVQGLLHASPNSAVGRLRVYADLEFQLTALQTAVTTDTAAVAADTTAVATAQAAFDLAYPDFATLTDPALIAAALASPEGVALTSAQTQLATDQATLAADQTALANGTANADAAFAVATKNPDNPAVKTYIDGLLAKYYAYLAAQ
jgi:hypothetical protein